jgi:hypothetical protein
MQNSDLIAKMGLAGMVVPGRKYHSPLPEELERFYCYLKDGGHSVVITLPSNSGPIEDYGVPAPVKAVLRKGYRRHQVLSAKTTRTGPVPPAGLAGRGASVL